MTKKLEKLKYCILRTKRAFKVKLKAFFIIFKRVSVAKNYLRPEGATLSSGQKLVQICQNPGIVTNSPFLIFYVRQFFVFTRLINKSLLEWFLLIIWKKHTLSRSTNSRNHPTLFWIKKRRSADNAYDLI